ncbi:MAG: peptidylprolyl isomerase [Leptospirillum sp.]
MTLFHKIFHSLTENSLKRVILASLVAGIAISSGCNKAPQKGVVATVGSDSITSAQLSAKLFSLGVQPPVNPNTVSDVLNHMVDQELLTQEAKSEGLASDPTIKSEIARAEDRILKKALLKKEVEDKLTVTDAEISDYYQKHEKEIRQPGYVEARQVVFPTQKDADHFKNSLSRKGGFKKAIKTFKGGPLGRIFEGTLPPKFMPFFFGVKEGAVTGPIILKDGVHYFRIDHFVTGHQLSLAESKEGIRRLLKREKRTDLTQALTNKLRAKTKININQPELATLVAKSQTLPGSPSSAGQTPKDH